MKILHGMAEVAGQGINTVKGLRANGYDAEMAVWRSIIMADAPDIDLKISKSKVYLFPLYALKMGAFTVKALAKYDVMHAHFGHSLFPFCLDVYLHKLFHLKCFAEFHGTDIRFIYNQNIKYPFYKNSIPSAGKIWFYRRQRDRLLKRVSGIVIHDRELLPHLPDAGKPVYIVPLRVNLDKIEPAYPDVNTEKKPVIVHAPSNRSTKGTEGILEALKSVKGDYELVIVENMSHDEAMKTYSRADILIDQVALGTYGVFSIEAMAMGKPVITYISPEMRESFPDELPIVSADFDTLAAAVDELIADPQKRHDLGVRGRAYAERYHDYKRVTKHLYKIYEGTAEETDLFKLL